MIAWFIILIVNGIDALPDGAPKSACSTLLPRHPGVTAQTSKAPYEIDVELADGKVIAHITSPDGEEFEGFILQARSSRNPNQFIHGEFTNSNLSKTIYCFDAKEGTLTHVNSHRKSEIMTEWTPLAQLNDEVIFRATVAKNFLEFWTTVDSNPVRLGNNSEHFIDEVEMVYEACFKTEGCVGLPEGCVDSQDCEVLLKYSKSSDGIDFRLLGVLESSKYMAMGLSEDAMMGDDSVTECIRDGTKVIARESWNVLKSNTRTSELSKDRYTGLFVDGLTSCSWTSPLVTVSNGQTYDFAKNKFYILLAAGEVTEWKLRYHDKRLASTERLNLTEFTGAAEVSDPELENSSDKTTEMKHPRTTPGHKIGSSTEEEGSSSYNTTFHYTSRSSCLNICLVFLIAGLFFATKDSMNVNF